MFNNINIIKNPNINIIKNPDILGHIPSGMEIFHAIQKPEVFQSTSLPSCDGDGALGCYRVPSDAAKHNLAVAAADADATAARDGADLLLQVAGVDRDLHVEHADQLHALIKH